MSNNGATELDPAQKLEQMKVVIEYIKFHIGLYLGTPAALVVIAQGFGVHETPVWATCTSVMLGLFLIAGVHAGLFMGKYINVKWDTALLANFESEAYRLPRRFMHHHLYWLGLGVGLVGIVWPKLQRLFS